MRVTWWRWDVADRCWHATLVPPQVPFPVGGGALLLPVRGARRWALCARGGATLNGIPCLPLEILEDRDEVRLHGQCYCFSVQAPPETITFAGSRKTVRCARCLDALEPGTAIVRCPACQAHHHQPCWIYDTRCQKCRRPTHVGVWMPEPLSER